MALETADVVSILGFRDRQVDYFARLTDVSVTDDGAVEVTVNAEASSNDAVLEETEWKLFVDGEQVDSEQRPPSSYGGGNTIQLSGGRAEGETEVKVEGHDPFLDNGTQGEKERPSPQWVIGTTFQAPQLEPAFSVTDIQQPQEVGLGEDFETEIFVENVGNEDGTVSITTDGFSEELTLAPGDKTSVVHGRTGGEAGVDRVTYDITNETVGGGGSVEAPVRVVPPSFEVTNIETPDEVRYGEFFDTRFVIENTSIADGDVTISTDGWSETLTVPAGETDWTTHERSIQEGGVQQTNYDITNEAVGGGGSVTVPTRVLAPAFEVVEIQPRGTVPVGQNFDVSFTVENISETHGNVTIRAEDFRDTVELDPGETGTLTHTRPGVTAGTHEFVYELLNATTGTATEVPLTVAATEKNVAIRNVDYPETVQPNEDYTGTFVVANGGNIPSQVRVAVGNYRETLSLDAGQTQMVEHPVTGTGPRTDNWTISATDTEDGELMDEKTATVEALDTTIGGPDSDGGQQSPPDNFEGSLPGPGSPDVPDNFEGALPGPGQGQGIEEVDDPNSDAPDSPENDSPEPEMDYGESAFRTIQRESGRRQAESRDGGSQPSGPFGFIQSLLGGLF